MASGETILEGWHSIGRLASGYFVVYLLIATFVFGAAITSTCALAVNAMFPDVLPQWAWAALHAVAAFLLIGAGRYGLFERIMKLFAAVKFGIVVLLGVLLAPSLSELALGLVPRVPGGLFLEHRCRYRRGRRYVHAGVVRLLGARARLAAAGVGTDDAHRRRHWLRPDRRVHGVHDDRRRAAPVRDGYLHRRQREPRHPGEPFGGALRALGALALPHRLLGSRDRGHARFVERGRPPLRRLRAHRPGCLGPRGRRGDLREEPLVPVVFGLDHLPAHGAAHLRSADHAGDRVCFFGALFFPFLALTLLYLLNSRRVDPEYRNRTLTNVVLVAAVLLFIAAGVQEVLNGLSGRAGG